jgi:hypothetical protein
MLVYFNTIWKYYTIITGGGSLEQSESMMDLEPTSYKLI